MSRLYGILGTITTFTYFIYMTYFGKYNIIQQLAAVYAAMFFAIVALNYIPGIHDGDGNMFGLFKLDLIDDVLHLASALWATCAVWYSYTQAVMYFKIFGVFYFTDSVVCLLSGQCLADLTIMTHRHDIELVHMSNVIDRLMLNLPHMVIGGGAIYIGFWLSKKINGLSH